MVRVRDAKAGGACTEAAQAARTQPAPACNQAREATIEKVLNELGAGPASRIKKIELEDNEKLVTIRAADRAPDQGIGSAVNLGVRNGAIYLSRGPIPGGRGAAASG